MQYESNIEMGVEIRHGIEHKIEIQGFVFGNEIENLTKYLDDLLMRAKTEKQKLKILINFLIV